MVENVKGFDFAQPDKKEQNLKPETFHIAIVTLSDKEEQNLKPET